MTLNGSVYIVGNVDVDAWWKGMIGLDTGRALC